MQTADPGVRGLSQVRIDFWIRRLTQILFFDVHFSFCDYFRKYYEFQHCFSLTVQPNNEMNICWAYTANTSTAHCAAMLARGGGEMTACRGLGCPEEISYTANVVDAD